MYRKQDFKKLDLLGSGKKHTKIYKVQHIQTNKIYALKEIEAKTLEKLNEYKEEAVQLSKVQDVHNVIKFYGYYFAETMYNTFRLGIITEYMDHNTNLETIYRKRKKANLNWKESELVTLLFSLISTCSYLQQKGICHRDIKPANLFLLQNGELKLIDFGESKDYVYDPNDESRNTFTMATIRGTPQYLSPILWKAHVIDGNSRYVEHNIYKSDVFSSGLVLYQMSSMQEVTGFNNKTPQTDGESVIKQSLIQLEKVYANQYVNIIALMLIFEESNRPSFVEIEQLFIEHENQAKELDSKIKLNDYIMLYNKYYNTLINKGPHTRDPDYNFKDILAQYATQKGNGATPQQALLSISNTQDIINSKGSTSVMINQQQSAITSIKGTTSELTTKRINEIPISVNNNNLSKKQKEMNFYKDSTLILNDTCFWFEFGGVMVGKFSTTKMKWKTVQKMDQPFGYHFTSIYVPDVKAFFLIGGQQGANFKVFNNNKVQLMKTQMPSNRFFASCVYYNRKVYVFGGYDSVTKVQLNSCMYYDISGEKWVGLSDAKVTRSQAAACRINDHEIVLFGGYNKEKGTLDSIERYLINENKWELLPLMIPVPLRRFTVVRIKKNLGLILGGLTKYSKENQRVWKIDWEKKDIIECEPLEKGFIQLIKIIIQGGVIESEVLVDDGGYLHLFLENANGTSPHAHIKYYFDPNAIQYITKND